MIMPQSDDGVIFLFIYFEFAHVFAQGQYGGG